MIIAETKLGQLVINGITQWKQDHKEIPLAVAASRVNRDFLNTLQNKSKAPIDDISKLKELMRESRDLRKGITRKTVTVSIEDKEKKEQKEHDVIIRDVRDVKQNSTLDNLDENFCYQSYVIQGLKTVQDAFRMLNDFEFKFENQDKQSAFETLNVNLTLKKLLLDFYLNAKSNDGNKNSLPELVKKLNAEVFDLMGMAWACTTTPIGNAELEELFVEYRHTLPPRESVTPIIDVGKVGNQEFFDVAVPGLADKNGKPITKLTRDKTEQNHPRNFWFRVFGSIPEAKNAKPQIEFAMSTSASLPPEHAIPLGPIDRNSHKVTPLRTKTSQKLKEQTQAVGDQRDQSYKHWLGADTSPPALLTLCNKEPISITGDNEVISGSESFQNNQPSVGLIRTSSKIDAQHTSHPYYSNRQVNDNQDETGDPKGIENNVFSEIINDSEAPQAIKDCLSYQLKDKFNASVNADDLYTQALATINAKESTLNPAQKKLFQAAITLKAITAQEFDFVSDNDLAFDSFIAREEKTSRILHVAALEGILAYLHGGEAGLKKFLCHITCRSGKDRTQWVATLINCMLRFYSLNGRFLPEPRDKDYQEQKEKFANIANTTFAEGMQTILADLGASNGGFGAKPNKAIIPKYLDKQLVDNTTYLTTAASASSKGFSKSNDYLRTPSRLAEAFFASSSDPKVAEGKSTPITSAQFVNHEDKLFEQLKNVVLNATTKYQGWMVENKHHESRFGKHGKAGYERAGELQAKANNWLQLSDGLRDIRKITSKRVDQNSLSMYIFDEINKDENKPLATLFSPGKSIQPQDIQPAAADKTTTSPKEEKRLSRNNIGFWARRDFQKSLTKTIDYSQISLPSKKNGGG